MNTENKKKLLERLGDIAESLSDIAYGFDELDGDMKGRQDEFDDDSYYSTDQGAHELQKAIDAIDEFRSEVDDLKVEVEEIEKELETIIKGLEGE